MALKIDRKIWSMNIHELNLYNTSIKWLDAHGYVTVEDILDRFDDIPMKYRGNINLALLIAQGDAKIVSK